MVILPVTKGDEKGVGHDSEVGVAVVHKVFLIKKMVPKPVDALVKELVTENQESVNLSLVLTGNLPKNDKRFLLYYPKTCFLLEEGKK